MSTVGSILGLFAIAISLVSAFVTYRGNRRMKLFKKHLLAARQHLHNSVQAYENGDVLEANLLLAAANEELERAQLYS